MIETFDLSCAQTRAVLSDWCLDENRLEECRILRSGWKVIVRDGRIVLAISDLIERNLNKFLEGIRACDHWYKYWPPNCHGNLDPKFVLAQIAKIDENTRSVLVIEGIPKSYNTGEVTRVVLCDLSQKVIIYRSKYGRALTPTVISDEDSDLVYTEIEGLDCTVIRPTVKDQEF